MELFLVIIVWAIYDWLKQNVFTSKRDKKLLEMKPLADRDHELWEQVFGKKK